MDVSLRQWPIFATGLLLGAAGTMALGLQRPTQAEIAAYASTLAAKTAAAPAPAATVAKAEPDAASVALADEQMNAAAEAFREQEALALAALAPPSKPKIRRVVKQPSPEPVIASSETASPIITAPTIAIAPNTPPEPSEPMARLRSATSVMGASPEGGEAARPQPD